MADATTPRQQRLINTLESVTGSRAPKCVRAEKSNAQAWISIALASLTEAEYGTVQKPPKPSVESIVDSKRISNFAAAAGLSLPADQSPKTLREWLCTAGNNNEIPDSDKLLNYWKDALRYRDLNEFANDDAKAISEAPIPEQLHQSLPKLSQDFKVPRIPRPGDAIALLLAYSPKEGKSSASALLGIPLAYDEGSRSLVPPAAGAIPFFNREWLEPPDPDAQKDKYFGEVLDCDEYLSDNPVPENASWPDYWAYIESFVQAITNASNPLPNLAPVVGRRVTAWKIVAWDAGGAGKRISDTYQQAIGGEQAQVLARLCSKSVPPTIFGRAEALQYAGALLGHIDTYNKDKNIRVGFGLETSQRVAATAMTQVSDGNLLTVNGPPGTGKTSFLRAVIGTMYVQSALNDGAPLMILATAATNKAVTNIIESFSDVAGPEMQPNWQSRWLPNLPSYGWFYPAASKLDDEYPYFMVLRKDWGNKGEPPKIIMTAASSSFFASQDQKRQWMLESYLELHRQASGMSSRALDAKHAADLIRQSLAQSVANMHALQVTFQRCLDVPNNHEAFLRPESAWLDSKVSLEAQLGLLTTQHIRSKSALQAWNQCLGLLRDAVRLRAERTGLLYVLKKLFIGDRLEIQAQVAEKTAIELISQMDPNFHAYGEPYHHAAERKKAVAVRRNTEIENQLRDIQRNLESTQSMLNNWDTWRTEIVQVATQLGADKKGIMEQVTAWAETGFIDNSSLSLRFEEALDKTFRFEHFHMAARYWEARWLADVPAPKDSGDTLLNLRRATMLAPVIVSTVYTLPGIHQEFQYADLLIFDESGQASPEIGAASFAFAKRAIVVGDIYQLKPVWNVGKEADKRLCADIDIVDLPEALSASVGSIMKTAQTATTFTTEGNATLGAGIGLVAHYRCRADIIEYCRRLIYGDGLSPCRIESAPNGQSGFLYPPMAWVAVTQNKSAQRENGSWINSDQIQEIVRWLRHDGPRILAHYGKTRLSDIVALIAPFRAQANALRKAIAVALGEEEATAMVINTVHALQGAEKPIVAFSLTQDEGNFFVNRDGPNLLNVAVSRAKDCFILFAAPGVIQPKMDRKTAYNPRNAKEKKPLDVLVGYLNEKGKRLYPREVVIIEAPGKETRVEEALGLSVQVVSTGGHFRRLKANGNHLEPEITNKDTLNALRKATEDLRHIDTFFLATDDDDDGEEIAWHVQEELRALGVDDPSRIRRMRFYSLAPQDIRKARQLALPGIDARRVRANLLRSLFDAALHQQLCRAGIKATRPQLALLREIAQREKVPGKWLLKVSGSIDKQEVTGYILEKDGKQPVTYDSVDAAVDAETMAVGILAPQWDSLSHSVGLPRYPAGTTAQTLIAAYRRYQWTPSRTMAALKALYLGHSNPKAYGIGSNTVDPATRGGDL
jgi:hypothetical protein